MRQSITAIMSANDNTNRGHKILQILIVSIIDHKTHRGGAGTVTRGLVKILESPPLNANIDCVVMSDYYSQDKFSLAIRRLLSILKSFFSNKPSKAIFTYSRGLVGKIKELVGRNDYDLIVINGSDLLWLLDHLPTNIPVVLIAHNIEHQLFLSQINHLHLPPLLRHFLLLDYRKLYKYEMSGLKGIRNIICVSSDDQCFIESRLSHEDAQLNITTINPLFDYKPTERCTEGNRINIGFIGNLNWWPNREGLNWFIKKVFPYLREGIVLHIFGEGELRCPKSPHLIKHGFVPNVEDIWSQFDLMICPIFSGGGINVKFCEAIYNKKLILATSFSLRGMSLSSPSITLSNNYSEWIAHLNQLDTSVGKQNRDSAPSSLFSWQVQQNKVSSFILNCVKTEDILHSNHHPKYHK